MVALLQLKRAILGIVLTPIDGVHGRVVLLVSRTGHCNTLDNVRVSQVQIYEPPSLSAVAALPAVRGVHALDVRARVLALFYLFDADTLARSPAVCIGFAVEHLAGRVA